MTVAPPATNTATPAKATLRGKVWSGTIASQTSREYFSNGKPANTCVTKWRARLNFRVGANGNIHGVGASNLQEATCTKGAPELNTQVFNWDITGRKSSDQLSIQLEVTSYQPENSVELGGYILLNTNGTCPFRLTPLNIPIVSSGTAEVQLHQEATLSNCGEASKDMVTNDSNAHFQYQFDCGNIPPEQVNSDAAKLCSSQ